MPSLSTDKIISSVCPFSVGVSTFKLNGEYATTEVLVKLIDSALIVSSLFPKMYTHAIMTPKIPITHADTIPNILKNLFIDFS